MREQRSFAGRIYPATNGEAAAAAPIAASGCWLTPFESEPRETVFLHCCVHTCRLPPTSAHVLKAVPSWVPTIEQYAFALL